MKKVVNNAPKNIVEFTQNSENPAIRLDHSRQHKSVHPIRLAWTRFIRKKVALFGLATLSLMSIFFLLAPVLSPYVPTDIDSNSLLNAPSSAHWFGTDDLGRDVLSRVLWGGGETLRVGFLAVAIGIIGGVLLGLVTTYIGGWVDTLFQRLTEIMLAFPVVLLLLSVIAILGPGLTTALLAIGIANIPWYARLVRGSVLSVKTMLYIDATRALGAKDWRIIFLHILPNMISPILIYGTLSLGTAIMFTAGLSYIGLGAQPPSPELGAMLNYGRTYLRTAWWMSIFPGLVVFIAVMSINLVGEGLRDALDPKTY
jgi:ABC-type dipeptide/oligopeptide/nickel transport system permease subunit